MYSKSIGTAMAANARERRVFKLLRVTRKRLQKITHSVGFVPNLCVPAGVSGTAAPQKYPVKAPGVIAGP